MYLYFVLLFVSYIAFKYAQKGSYFREIYRWCNWTNYSPKALEAAEKKILSCLKSPYSSRYVDIGPIVGKRNNKIWTIMMNESSKEVPIVMVHGMGAAIGLWALNLDQISQDRTLYAIDVLGFGRSSRPNFSTDPKVTEMQMVAAFEEWRREMKLEKFILLGHSLGAYISLSYTMQYPARVEHLIMADPWGLSETPRSVSDYYKMNTKKRIMAYIMKHFNPMLGLRLAGPWGLLAIKLTRPDLSMFFKQVFDKPTTVVPNYVHQCNVRKPTGEDAFHTLMHGFAFAKNAQIHRIHRLDEDIPLTIIYGSKSWVDRQAGQKIKEMRPNSYVNVEIQEGSGHHLNCDRPELFNKYVLNACQYKNKMQRS